MGYQNFNSVEEIKDYLAENNFDGIDSEYSKQTLELINEFKSKGADLNKWWVMTPVYWECPACGRAKSQIVRLNKHGYLTCHLHAHHDHMKDYVKQRFEYLASQRETVVADEDSERFALKTSYAISAYDNTVICSDCNEVDKEAKIAVGTHPYFSFSPSEIKKFVIPSNNAKHGINIEIAKKIWEQGQSIFQSRLELAEHLANIAAENKNWYQRSYKSAKETERAAYSWFRRYGIDSLSSEPEKLLYTTQRFKGDYDSWRKKRYPIKSPPSPKEIEKLIAVRGKFWKRCSMDWICPCCGRNKEESIQISNKKTWSFRHIQKYFYDSTSLRRYSMKEVCNECSNSATLLAQEALSIANKQIETASHLISIDELRSVVIARPNSKHNIDNEKADELLLVLLERLYSNDYAD